jgi:hypothetical protein
MLLGTFKRRGGRAVMCLLVGLLLGGTLGALGAYFVKRGKAGIPGGPRLGAAEEMSLVPADAAGFIHIRARDLWNTEGFAELRKIVEKAGPDAARALDEGFVPAPSTIERVTVVFIHIPRQPEPLPKPKGIPGKDPPKLGPPGKGGFPPQPGKGGFPPQPGKDGVGVPGGPPGGVETLIRDLKVVFILAFKDPYDAKKVRDADFPEAESKTVGTREYWQKGHLAAHFPNDKVLVVGDADGMKMYLAKPTTTPGPLTSAIQLAREGGRHVVASVNVTQLSLTPRMFEGGVPELRDASKELLAILKAESLTIGLALGEETKLDIRARYKDDAAATESEAALRDLAKMAREKLKEPKKHMEETLQGKPGQPRPRPIEELPTALLAFLGVGSLNSLDEWLADPPLTREGSDVVLTPKVPSLTTTTVAAVAMTAGTLMPAIEKVQAATSRVKDSNNLKQLGQAMFNYEITHGKFPPQDGKINPEAKGGLSWRVHLLPFIEQEALYKEFNLDEPWDSEHNKKLIDRMPATFASPLVTDPPGQTRYKVFSGRDAVIYPGSQTRLVDITDGTSNTILIVGGGEPVTWTKPEDIEFTGGAVQPAVLALPGQTGCNVCMVDGAVRWVELSRLTPEKLKAAITRAGGEVGGLDP